VKDTVIKKYKFWWPWQDNRQELWLQDMARNGLHLQGANLFCRYTFKKGEPQETTYRLDFLDSAKKDASYYQIFIDAGWEHVVDLNGWQVWRIRSANNQHLDEIFTDTQSKIGKYKRMLTQVSLAFVALGSCIWNPRIYELLVNDADFIHMAFGAIAVSLFIVLSYSIIRIYIRIREIRQASV